MDGRWTVQQSVGRNSAASRARVPWPAGRHRERLTAGSWRSLSMEEEGSSKRNRTESPCSRAAVPSHPPHPSSTSQALLPSPRTAQQRSGMPNSPIPPPTPFAPKQALRPESRSQRLSQPRPGLINCATPRLVFARVPTRLTVTLVSDPIPVTAGPLSTVRPYSMSHGMCVPGAAISAPAYLHRGGRSAAVQSPALRRADLPV
ncbi:hypothetical protein ANO11243_080180 [Dothideomycetidae sp. 11243]|nr:hypothetical protein ANO11243_080180 [fungal sp. No.11243]